MASSDLVVVQTFNSRPEADVAKSALDAAGIDAMVLADDAGGVQPGLWEGRGVAIVVNRDDEEAARDILDCRNWGEDIGADYDRIADRYDRRFELFEYPGISATLATFLGRSDLAAVVEVGCGTGHWLGKLAERSRLVVGMDVSARMIARASPRRARLVRGRAEALPWRDSSFDRVVCINALHHFRDRHQFFVEARRVLKRGGGLLSIGMDPHAERDSWWVYDYFPETQEIDRQRFAPVRILRGELAHADFAWAESFEAEHLEAVLPLRRAFPDGTIDHTFASQLTLIGDEAFAAGVARIREAGDEAQLATDIHLFATIGWLT